MQILLIEAPNCKNDTLTERLMRRYSRLACFIENVDLFDNDFLVIPLNNTNHWSLCVVCCPNRLFERQEMEDQSNVIGPTPCILMFDSQMATQEANLQRYGAQIREFLQVSPIPTSMLIIFFSLLEFTIMVTLTTWLNAFPINHALLFSLESFRNKPTTNMIAAFTSSSMHKTSLKTRQTS
jgi:hypothetical protein